MRSIRSAQLLSCKLLVLTLLTGSAAFGKGDASVDTATLQQVQDDYYQAELQVAATQDALTELTISPACDLQQAFGVFADNVNRMNEYGKPLLVHADMMRYGASYLVESRQTTTACPLPGQKGVANQRTVELGEYFDDISEQAWEVKRAYREYEFDLDQIRNSLSENVTSVAVDTLNQIIRKAEVDSDSLQDALVRVQDAVAAAKAKSPASQPEQQPTAQPAPQPRQPARR